MQRYLTLADHKIMIFNSRRFIESAAFYQAIAILREKKLILK